MIWSDNKIRAWLDGGGVTPAEPANINPASLDLRLGTHYRTPTPDGWSEAQPIPESGLVLKPGAFVLLSTLEYTCIPSEAVAFLYLKSSTGRKGLEHLHAGYGDPGFCGQWTLELINHWPYPRTVKTGERLFQVVLADCHPVGVDYAVTGHYQGQTGPTVQWNGK